MQKPRSRQEQEQERVTVTRAGRLREVLTCLMAALALVVVSATPSAGAKPVGELTAEIVVLPDVNPDFRGRPSPVRLRIIQLRATSAFESADFFAIAEDEAAALGGDYISHATLLVKPEENTEIVLDIDPEATHVGVVAAFRDIENAAWWGVAEVPDRRFLRRVRLKKPPQLRIEVGALSVTVTVES